MDVQAILKAIAKTAARLCDADDAVIFQAEGDQLRLVVHIRASPGDEDVRPTVPHQPRHYPRPCRRVPFTCSRLSSPCPRHVREPPIKSLALLALQRPPVARGRASSPQARFATIMAAGLLWAGCAAPVAVRTSERGEAARALESRDGVTVAFWSDFSPETHEGLGEEMVACITSAIRSSLPGVRLIPEDDFYRTVFPGRKPGEVLLNAVALATFFQQTEFRQRVAALGVTRLPLGDALSLESPDHLLAELLASSGLGSGELTERNQGQRDEPDEPAASRRHSLDPAGRRHPDLEDRGR